MHSEGKGVAHASGRPQNSRPLRKVDAPIWGCAVPGATTRGTRRREQDGHLAARSSERTLPLPSSLQHKPPSLSRGRKGPEGAGRGQGRARTWLPRWLGPLPAPIRYTHFELDGHANCVPSSDRQRVPGAGAQEEPGTDWNTQRGLSPPFAVGDSGHKPAGGTRPGRPPPELGGGPRGQLRSGDGWAWADGTLRSRLTSPFASEVSGDLRQDGASLGPQEVQRGRRRAWCAFQCTPPPKSSLCQRGVVGTACCRLGLTTGQPPRAQGARRPAPSVTGSGAAPPSRPCPPGLVRGAEAWGGPGLCSQPLG